MKLDKLDVSIYPNPTNGNVNVAYNGLLNYVLYTIDGALLVQGSAANNETISLENYTSGIYYITINSDNKSAVYKVVKQ